jgi:Ni/Co efflux regulator RcnB
MKSLNLKRNMKQLLLLVAAFVVAVPAVPAFAQPDRHQERQEHRQQYERREPERRDHERHERFDRDRREHREYRFAYRGSYVGPSCYTQGGYWTWDGWQHVWVPPQTVCD